MTKQQTLLNERRALPIWQHRRKLVDIIRTNLFTIIISSTGSGKTTQIPQFLLEAGVAGKGMIAITQPRRIAAISVAERVSQEMGAEPISSGQVAYKVRFESTVVPGRTRICYMTEGSLLREASVSPDLPLYSVIILDEAHERTVNMEFLFGILKRSSTKRQLTNNPLKVIVMSATIDPAPYVKYFGEDQTHAVYIDGQGYNLSVRSIKEPITDYVMQAALACVQINLANAEYTERGILIFLSGEDEIYQCIHLIKHINRSFEEKDKKTYPIDVCPLFSALSQPEQKRAVGCKKIGVRKVIVSTNVAETSITIPGVCIVIDSGKVKIPEYDGATGIERLRVNWVTKSQAAQRAGRANREHNGVVFRLYTDEEYENNMAYFPPSQMIVTPTADVLLNLFALGIQDLDSFPWLERPANEAIKSGLDLLHRLEAITYPSQNPSSNSLSNGHINGSGNFSISIPRQVTLTAEGRLMLHFPLPPRMARVILSAAKHKCLIETLTVISMLFISPVFHVPQDKRQEFNEISKRFHHPDGDLVRLLLVFRGFTKILNSNSSVGSNHLSLGVRRARWCRENYLVLARMKSALKIRSQLRELVLRSEIGRLTSCGSEDFSPLLKAFFEVAYRDQVTSLVKNTSENGLEIGNTPQYRRHCEKFSSDESKILSIHPESTLYGPAIIDKNPPKALLYIEAVGLGDGRDNERIMMRHIAAIPSDWLTDEDPNSVKPAPVVNEEALSSSAGSSSSLGQMNSDNSPKSQSRKMRRRHKWAARKAKRRRLVDNYYS